MIGYAVQKGNRVWIYDENDHPIHNYEGMLLGFYASSVVIKAWNSNQVSIYDENGCHVRTISN